MGSKNDDLMEFASSTFIIPQLVVDAVLSPQKFNNPLTMGNVKKN